MSRWRHALVRLSPAATLLALLATAGMGHALPPPLRVQGRPSLEVAARRDATSGTVDTRGRALGDNREPIADASVQLQVPAGMSTPTPCDPSTPVELSPQRRVATVKTDAAGEFCVRWPGLTSDPQPRFEFELLPTEFYSGVSASAGLDEHARTLQLAFRDLPVELSLERPQQTFSVTSRVSPPHFASEPPERVNVRVSLEGAQPAPDAGSAPARPLAKASMGAGETAELLVASSQLGAPGPATLVATSEGSSSVSAATTRVSVIRSAAVELAMVGPRPDDDPVEADELLVQATTLGGRPPEGAVEATVAGVSVASAPLLAGRARLDLRALGSEGGRAVDVEVSYLPAAPWWHAAKPLRMWIAPPPPSPWYYAAWGALAAAVAYWTARNWRRPGAQQRAPSHQARSANPGLPAVVQLQTTGASHGWQGEVVDAHTGRPLPGVELSALLPGFNDSTLLWRTCTDPQGRFVAPPEGSAKGEGAQLRVTARLHSSLSQPLPAPGRLQVRLVSRRRAVLQRLLDWARRDRAPQSRLREPTPAELALAARHTGSGGIQAWAEAVEQAAFAGREVDQAAEDRVEQLAQAARGRATRETKPTP